MIDYIKERVSECLFEFLPHPEAQKLACLRWLSCPEVPLFDGEVVVYTERQVMCFLIQAPS